MSFLCFFCVRDTAATRWCMNVRSTPRSLLNIKVKGQGHMGLLCVSCLHDTRGQYLALSEGFAWCGVVQVIVYLLYSWYLLTFHGRHRVQSSNWSSTFKHLQLRTKLLMSRLRLQSVLNVVLGRRQLNINFPSVHNGQRNANGTLVTPLTWQMCSRTVTIWWNTSSWMRWASWASGPPIQAPPDGLVITAAAAAATTTRTTFDLLCVCYSACCTACCTTNQSAK